MDNREKHDTIETDWLKPENRFKATPMDLFKQGLRTGNWEAISVAYMMLTGEKINAVDHQNIEIYIPSESEQSVVLQPNTPEPIQVILEPIKPPPEPHSNKEVTTSPPAYMMGIPSDCIAKATGPNGRAKKFTRANTHDCHPRDNKWKDDGTEARDEIIQDRKVPTAILEAQRPPVPTIQARCQGCGKIDMVEPGLVPGGLRLTPKYRMRYLCNSCCVGAKSSVEAEGGDDDALYEGEFSGTTLD